MAGTPDEETLAAAEAAHLARRETVALDLEAPAGPGRPRQRAAVRASAAPVAPGANTRRRRLLRGMAAATVNALLAALTAIAPVAALTALALITAGQHLSIAGSLRFGLAGWLLSLGVPLETEYGQLTLAPLALGTLAAWRIMRAGVHTTRALGARGSRSPRRALRVGAAVGLGYAFLAGLAGWLADGDLVGVAPLRAALHGLVLGTLFAVLGALRETGAIQVVAQRVPRVVRDATRTGAVGAMLVIAAGGATTGLVVALRGGEASSVLAAYHTGVAGQAGVTLVSLAVAPNVAVWASAYLLGPGFSLGADSIVRASGVAAGPLPALPLVVAMPGAQLHGVAYVLLGLPLLAGITAGWLLTRRRLRPRDGVVPVVRWGHLLTGSLMAGPIAGVLLGLAALASGGTLTSTMGHLGPEVLPVVAAGSGVIALGCLLGALGTRPFYARGTKMGDPEGSPIS
ncbi:cell division protein PerM [Hamadaea tsunoensis]|uniref:cell division protein PerM n=1 Tax=Hamadaea tsunoensis TaxID=53368 RepID=UPI0009FBF1D4|nr:DUF6350 family protein [Hamadaea tsunoensis]